MDYGSHGGSGDYRRSESFRVVEKKTKDKVLEERLLLGSKIEASSIERVKVVTETIVAANGARLDFGPPARLGLSREALERLEERGGAEMCFPAGVGGNLEKGG